MKITVTKRDAFEVMVSRTPVLFTVREEWQGFSLLRDDAGRTLIVRVGDESPFSKAFGDVFGLMGKDKPQTITAITCSPELIGLLDEDMSGELVKAGGGSKV